ncbi:MAG TPA: DoxX family protein [Pseudonocardiaceae bacterium]|nr:DoxX family protein [Pseudonocardiaceae bacterium]
METTYNVVAAVLAALLVAAGLGAIVRAPAVVTNMTRVGVPEKAYLPLALCEFAGAAGLVIGIWWPPLGVAASIGLVLYFVLAIGQHVRTGDVKGSPPAGLLLVMAVAALVVRLASL